MYSNEFLVPTHYYGKFIPLEKNIQVIFDPVLEQIFDNETEKYEKSWNDECFFEGNFRFDGDIAA